MDAVGIALIALAMCIGVLGTLLPILPGIPVAWGAALVYGLIEGFDAVGWIAFAIITLLAVAGLAAGAILPARRVSALGAPRSTLFMGLLLGVTGFFVLPVIGLPIGAAAGIFLAEQRRLGDRRAAWTTTKNLLVGFGLGALAQFGAGLAMIIVWAIWVVAG